MNHFLLQLLQVWMYNINNIVSRFKKSETYAYRLYWL